MLGGFEVEVGDANRQTVSDTMAARILAYLAYRREFCSRDEIVRACWGPNKVSGRNRLEDEAYQRQVSNVRALLGSWGVAWQECLLCQPNGLQLRDGAYTTDLLHFNDLLEIGLDPVAETADRLKALQEADGLRRGYLLDGMHCEWIVAQDGGARSDYSARVQRLRREMLQLQSPPLAAGQTSKYIAYCDGFYEVIPQLRSALIGALEEIVLCGVSLHLTIPVVQDVLLERMRAGVSIRVLLLNPESPRLNDYAELMASDVLTLRQENALSLHRLGTLGKQIKGVASAGVGCLQVGLIERAIQGRVCAIDSNTDRGQVFYFPYLDGVSDVQLPGYVWQRIADGPFLAHVGTLSRATTAAKIIDS